MTRYPYSLMVLVLSIFLLAAGYQTAMGQTLKEDAVDTKITTSVKSHLATNDKLKTLTPSSSPLVKRGTRRRRSIRSSNGPESFARYCSARWSGHLQCRRGSPANPQGHGLAAATNVKFEKVDVPHQKWTDLRRRQAATGLAHRRLRGNDRYGPGRSGPDLVGLGTPRNAIPTGAVSPTPIVSSL